MNISDAVEKLDIIDDRGINYIIELLSEAEQQYKNHKDVSGLLLCVSEALTILRGMEKVTGEEVKQAGFSDHIGYNFGRVADEINERIFGE